MNQDKQWIINAIPDDRVREISERCNISKLLAKVFLSRGIDNEQYIKDFLVVPISSLHDPFLLKDMDKAVNRIIHAINNKERVVVFGDYDVDGITSTSILVDFFKGLGANVGYYIPDRRDEGYGLSIPAAKKLIESNVSLIVTVDCGVTAFDETTYINQNNVDIIITDHHECQDELPAAYALINPVRHDCEYPFKSLAGVGVVFKLVAAMCTRLGIEDRSMSYLDLVALGTVADVVSLLDENRIIVKYGLKKIEHTSNRGLNALIDVSGAKNKKITSYTIGFALAPRINAAGRIGDASKAVTLLTTHDDGEALAIANELNEQNIFRQQAEQGILEDVLKMIEESVDLQREKVIVVSGKQWHHGIIGIVASKITESFNRPCILITIESGVGKGSGRSIEGFNLFEALCQCSHLFERFGGHDLAAGLSIKEENIDEFKMLINQYADKVINDCDLIPKVIIDVGVTGTDVSYESVKELEMLAPFGADNPSPVFEYKNLTIEYARAVGNNRHIKVKFNDNGVFFDAIGFNRGYLADVYSDSDVLDVACSLEINSWNNRECVQLNIKDLRVNNDTRMCDEFYNSLDSVIDINSVYEDNVINQFLNKIMITGLLDALHDIDNYRIAILVNSIDSLKAIMTQLNGMNIEYTIMYGGMNKDVDKGVFVAVNAISNETADLFDKIYIYGEWICKNYLYGVIKKIKHDKLFVLGKMCFKPEKSDIIIERRDMVAVYQYIKGGLIAVPEEDGLQQGYGIYVIVDLYRFAHLVSKSYRINMNFFKAKRIIEIFEELKLFKKLEYSKRGMKLMVIDTKGKKVDLESSTIFRAFQTFGKRI